VKYTHTLEKSLDIVSERGKQYGDVSFGMEKAAKIASQFLNRHVTPYEVCIIMMSIKASRIANNESHHDSWVDMLAYASFASSFVAEDADIVNMANKLKTVQKQT